MRNRFLTPAFLILLAACSACQGKQQAGQENLDTVLLAVPPMFDAPLPAPKPVIVPLVTDSTKKDNSQAPKARRDSSQTLSGQSQDTTKPHAAGNPDTKPQP